MQQRADKVAEREIAAKVVEEGAERLKEDDDAENHGKKPNPETD